MSRYKTRDKDLNTVFYGFDTFQGLGYWLDIYEEGKDEPIVEESTRLTGLNNGRMLQLISERGIEIPQDHRDSIALDLEF